MPNEAAIPEDLEQLRRRFEEFRATRSGRSRFPDSLWAAAAEMAKRYGVNRTTETAGMDAVELPPDDHAHARGVVLWSGLPDRKGSSWARRIGHSENACKSGLSESKIERRFWPALERDPNLVSSGSLRRISIHDQQTIPAKFAEPLKN
ncbi:MAG: hypothetical protein WAM39_14555 [Bryobacteraceae bacterium]